MPENELHELSAKLTKTNKLLKRYVSFKQAFLRGIIGGLGGIIGATIVLTIILSILSQLEFVPIVGNFAIQIVEFVKENTSK